MTYFSFKKARRRALKLARLNNAIYIVAKVRRSLVNYIYYVIPSKEFKERYGSPNVDCFTFKPN